MKTSPFFLYFGGKFRLAKEYDPPLYSTIIEPFAGAAGYSTRYWSKNVVLYDINPVIFGVWDYLIRSTEADIRALPVDFESVDELNICQEAKWFIGFWTVKGAVAPQKRIVSSWSKGRSREFWSKWVRGTIASQVKYIKHWKVYNRSYESVENINTTWFIDPPYQSVGKNYKYHDIDYSHLADWCRRRKGQIIICENDGASWLPFRKLTEIQGTRKTSTEAIWTNEPTSESGRWAKGKFNT